MATPQHIVDYALNIRPDQINFADLHIHRGVLDALRLRRLLEDYVGQGFYWEDWLFCRSRWAREYNAYIIDIISPDELERAVTVAQQLRHSYVLAEQITRR